MRYVFTITKQLLMQAISLKKVVYFLLILALIFIGARFLIINLPQYFIFTEQSYSPYFWSRSEALFTHIFLGMVAFVIGPFQFIPFIRKKYVKTHRTMGKIYLLCISVSAPVAIYLAATSQINFVYASGLVMLATAWITTSLMAYISIRKKLFSTHREWMVRSYVVTFAFATFRLMGEVLDMLGVGPFEMRAAFLSWACWSIPLLVTEVIFQIQKFNRIRSSQKILKETRIAVQPVEETEAR